MSASDYQRSYWSQPEMRHYQRDRRRARRAEFFADKACVDCGSTSELELDHVDPNTKAGHDVWLWSEARRIEEIAKCVVRCRTCHQERHASERRRHGINAYNQRGCRCEICRAAKAAARSKGPDLNRTGVYGFAGRRVNHSATGPATQDDTSPSLREAA